MNHATYESDEENMNVDGVYVEDWLLKQREHAAQSQKGMMLDPPTRTPGVITSKCMMVADESGSNINVKLQKVSWRGDSSDAYIQASSPQSLNGAVEELLDASVREHDQNSTKDCPPDEIFTAKLATSPKDNMVLIEGVISQHRPMHRRLVFFIGIFVVVVVFVVVLTLMMTTKKAHPTPITVLQESNPKVLFNQDVGNLNWTIADAIVDWAIQNGMSTTSFVGLASGKLILAKLNSTDMNYTHIGASVEANLLDNVPLAMFKKMITSLWNGHMLDIFEGLSIEGQAVALEDMYDGMTLTSMAGYPLQIQLNPFRINNASVSLIERNLKYKNGIIHRLSEYPQPLVHWIGKSSLDILLALNDQRNGDLSVFIGLINALPELKEQLLLIEGNTDAITLFVPTNDAMAPLDLIAVSEGDTDIEPLIELLVRNHFVSGNFARSGWWTIPTGIKMSESELGLDTQAGQRLALEIGDNVIIDGASTIIQEDVFSENGIIHIINLPLFML